MRRFIRILATLGGFAAAGHQGLTQTTTVAVSPSSQGVSTAEQFTTAIVVSNVTDLHAANVRLAFNKSILQYNSATLGPFLSGAFMPAPFVVTGAVMDTINMDQAILGPGGASGFGTLLTVTFTALSAGTSPLALVGVDLRSSTNAQIPSLRTSGEAIVSAPTIVANAKVFLEGPFNGTGMNTALRSGGLLPLAQPYGSAPWNFAGTETVPSVPANIVDWLLVEVRSDLATTIAARAALLRNDGMIVDMDGVSPVAFPGITAKSYYIVICHRNHLDIASAAPVPLSNASALYDFTTALTKASGADPMKGMGTGGTAPFAMYAANASSGDGVINAADRVIVKSSLGSATYSSADLDMNGIVNAADQLKAKTNLGKTTSVP